MSTDNLTPMIAKGARMKHAFFRAVSFFGLYLGFCAFLLVTSIEVHSANDTANENNLPKDMRLSINESSSALNDISSDQNLKTNTLIKGIVTETRFLPKNSTREYEYSVLRNQDGWYSIRLVSQQTNVMSEAYSDLVDTIVENAPTEALMGVMPSPEKYTRRFSISPTPYPLCADSMLQAVWLTLCADRNAMANSISKCPPGIIFTYPMRFDPYNIYSLIVENEIYDEFGEGLLRGFEINGPEESLISELDFEEHAPPWLKKLSLSRVYDFFGSKTTMVSIPLSVSSGTNRWKQCVFSSSGHFNSTSYPEQSTLLMYSPHRYGLDGECKSQELLTETEVKVLTVETSIDKSFFPPPIDSSLVEVKDFRFNGLKGEMGYRIVDKVWPLTGTESYQKWKELFIQKTLFEEHNYNAPKSFFLTIILILLILASPFIVNFIKWKKPSKVKRIIK